MYGMDKNIEGILHGPQNVFENIMSDEIQYFK